jgi:cytochrome c-type biogenesis protein CcmH
VELAAALKAQARPEDTVYVFARNADPAGGNRMPLAIVKAQVKDLPLPFTLDDTHAMGPGMGLSTAKRVVVGARISRSGQAIPQPGDLEGLSAPVDVGARDVRVEISRVLP